MACSSVSLQQIGLARFHSIKKLPLPFRTPNVQQVAGRRVVTQGLFYLNFWPMYFGVFSGLQVFEPLTSQTASANL